MFKRILPTLGRQCPNLNHPPCPFSIPHLSAPIRTYPRLNHLFSLTAETKTQSLAKKFSTASPFYFLCIKSFGLFFTPFGPEQLIFTGDLEMACVIACSSFFSSKSARVMLLHG